MSTIALLIAFALTAAVAAKECKFPGTNCEPEVDPDIPQTPRPTPRPTPKPPKGSFSISAERLHVISSSDGFPRGCDDPWTYHIYARVILGERGSTVVRRLGRVDWGNGRCAGARVTRNGAGKVNDKVPTDRVALEAYVVVGVEEDDYGASILNSIILSHIMWPLEDHFKSWEGVAASPSQAARWITDGTFYRALKFPQNYKSGWQPVPGFNHDWVGVNTVVFVSGTGATSQPATCHIPVNPICLNMDVTRSLRLGSGGSIWMIKVDLDAA